MTSHNRQLIARAKKDLNSKWGPGFRLLGPDIREALFLSQVVGIIAGQAIESYDTDEKKARLADSLVELASDFLAATVDGI